MGIFSVNKEVFPIGISLYGPIRGTRSDGKLNLIIYLLIILLIYIKKVLFSVIFNIDIFLYFIFFLYL